MVSYYRTWQGAFRYTLKILRRGLSGPGQRTRRLYTISLLIVAAPGNRFLGYFQPEAARLTEELQVTGASLVPGSDLGTGGGEDGHSCRSRGTPLLVGVRCSVGLRWHPPTRSQQATVSGTGLGMRQGWTGLITRPQIPQPVPMPHCASPTNSGDNIYLTQL